MTRGRKPLPTHLKIISGTAKKARLNAHEPRPMIARPAPPPELSDDAKVEWERVVAELFQLGIVTQLDRGILGAYCQAHGRWQQAERTLAKMARMDDSTGALLIKTQGGNTIQNPIVGIANKAMGDMVKYAVELGLTPSARGRVHANPRDDDDPAGKYGA